MPSPSSSAGSNVARALSVRDVCHRLGVGPHTVLAWIGSGELRAINAARRAGSKRPNWRIPPESLTAFEAARSVAPPTPRTPRRKRSDDGIIRFYGSATA